jgi:ATP-dependent helicase HrpB
MPASISVPQDPEVQRAAISPDPRGKRRVILATPIAESSLTIEGVRIVVDSGLRKERAFCSSHFF